MPEIDARFDYDIAFSRSRGFISEAEQERLRKARVAVAGLGGTGGAQVHALTRMGIGRFTLADPDVFELVNFNRQMGASLATIGRAKTSVAADLVHSINPEADVRLLPEGIDAENLDRFLEGVDVVVDSLDFYCFKERMLLYPAARERGLWVFTAPPLGFGFTLLGFDPKGMRFEDYFGFRPGMTERQMIAALIAGIAPRPYMLRYLDLSSIDVAQRRLPSLAVAPFLVAGVIATEAVNLLIGRRRPSAAPAVVQYDPLAQRYRRHVYPLGMRAPLQRLKRLLIQRRLPPAG